MQGGGMDHDSIDQYTQFFIAKPGQYTVGGVSASPATTTLTASSKWFPCLDLLDDGLSAVYTLYEPETHCSYGTYGVLWQIEQVRALGLAHVYLGYWIQASPKMSYKASTSRMKCCTSNNGNGFPRYRLLAHPHAISSIKCTNAVRVRFCP